MSWLFQRMFGRSASVPVLSTVFPEEPLSHSGDQGCGFFLARAGLLLHDGRYKILRKLGRGQYSTTWLVSDSQCIYKFMVDCLSHSSLIPERKECQHIMLSKY